MHEPSHAFFTFSWTILGGWAAHMPGNEFPHLALMSPGEHGTRPQAWSARDGGSCVNGFPRGWGRSTRPPTKLMLKNMKTFPPRLQDVLL